MQQGGGRRLEKAKNRDSHRQHHKGINQTEQETGNSAGEVARPINRCPGVSDYNFIADGTVAVLRTHEDAAQGRQQKTRYGHEAGESVPLDPYVLQGDFRTVEVHAVAEAQADGQAVQGHRGGTDPEELGFSQSVELSAQ